MKPAVSTGIKAALTGAACFWTPDILVHALRRYSFDRSDVLVISIAMPLALFIAWAGGTKLFHTSAGATAVGMVVGIWMLGGICMAVGASFSGGGFVGPEGLRGALLVVLMSLLPIYTFIMATYDGSLGALLLVTVILLLAAVLPLRVLKAKHSAEGPIGNAP